METLTSITNIIAVLGALAAAFLGLMTYRSQKNIDLEFKFNELKRDAVTQFLSSIEELVNHAAFTENKEDFDQARTIIRCKADLNKVYVYATKELAEVLDNAMLAAINLSNVVSEIPNSKIREQEQVVKYQEESDELDRLYNKAVNIARADFGLNSEPIERTQILILGKHEKSGNSKSTVKQSDKLK